MDDLMGKIGEVLSDDESKKQLSELLQMLISDDTSDNSDSVQSDSDNSTENVSDAGPDLSFIFKLTGLMSAFSQSDKNSELLLALKPHLKEEKQKKVDKAGKNNLNSLQYGILQRKAECLKIYSEEGEIWQ